MRITAEMLAQAFKEAEDDLPPAQRTALFPGHAVSLEKMAKALNARCFPDSETDQRDGPS